MPVITRVVCVMLECASAISSSAWAQEQRLNGRAEEELTFGRFERETGDLELRQTLDTVSTRQQGRPF